MQTARGRGTSLTLVSLLVGLAITQAEAQSVVNFYQGKTLRVIVGYAPGGGFDQYARLLAKYLPRYLPGTPSAIVQNMPGSSSIVATHYILKVAPKDGTIIGIPNHNLFLDQVLSRPTIFPTTPTRETACRARTAGRRSCHRYCS